jgi:hypothetical protein
MKKTTLNDKINSIKKIFISCTIVYIVFSLLYLNDYSTDAHFDPKKIYETVKDGLTLAAAFLAPVAAFVLFNDWREEHGEKRNESIVLGALQRLKEKSNDLRRIVTSILDEFDESPEEMLDLHSGNINLYKNELLVELGVMANSKIYFEDKTFHDKAISFCQNEIEMLDQLKNLFSSYETVNGDQYGDTEEDYQNWANQNFINSKRIFFPKAEQFINNFDCKIQELESLAEQYKI